MDLSVVPSALCEQPDDCILPVMYVFYAYVSPYQQVLCLIVIIIICSHTAPQDLMSAILSQYLIQYYIVSCSLQGGLWL